MKQLILFNSDEKLYKYVSEKNLQTGSIAISRLETLEINARNGRQLAEMLIEMPRVIMPDFHQNPESYEILTTIALKMVEAGIDTTPLMNYVNKKYPKEQRIQLAVRLVKAKTKKNL